MDCLTHEVIAAERERHIANAAGNKRTRKLLLDVSASLNEIDSVVIVLFYTRRNCENIGVENDVCWVEVDADKQVVAALADFLFSFQRICLP